MDLISVIVPIYKVEKYLDKCIESIINQTYQKLEIILVDDGSPDNCGRICDEYKKKDKRIKVIHKTNGGLSDARNKGIEISTGKYISFIDSDDFIEENMLEKLYENIIAEQADISICDYRLIYEDESIYDKSYERVNQEKIEIYNTETAIKKLLSKESFGDYAWNKLYKKSLFTNIKYPIGKKMEDLGTTYKLFYKSEKIIYINLKLYNYLQRNNSIANNKTESLMTDRIELALERYKYIKKTFPFMPENDIFLLTACVDSYRYISTLILRKKCEKIIKEIPYKTKIIKLTDFKNRIKIAIYLINKHVYYYIFSPKKER